MTPDDLGDLAEGLVPIAAQLVGAVHDDGVADVARVLELLGTDPLRVHGMLVVLAAMVDPTKSAADLLRWVTWDDVRTPDPTLFQLEAQPPSQDPRTWSDAFCHARHGAWRRLPVAGEHRSEWDLLGYREWERRRKERERHDPPTKPPSTPVASPPDTLREEAS